MSSVDNNGVEDVFVYDRASGTLSLVSRKKFGSRPKRSRMSAWRSLSSPSIPDTGTIESPPGPRPTSAIA